MKCKRIFILALVALAPVVHADTKPIRVGALMVLTGQYAMQGSAFREGLELAVAEINDRGGSNDQQIELLWCRALDAKRWGDQCQVRNN